MIKHTTIPLLYVSSTGICLHAYSGLATSRRLQTQKCHRPAWVGNMTTELSILYSIADSFKSRIELPRVGARSFGQLALAGLLIL